MAEQKKENTTPATVAKPKPTASERFLAQVEKQFVAELGEATPFNAHEKTLAQHLFVKVDYALKAAEVKRLEKNNANTTAPIVWENIDMAKLCIDAVHRVALGLDALVDDHIYPIAYFNNHTKKYDLDLRIGYKGKHYLRTVFAVNPPKAIFYELVYKSDKFTVYKRSKDNPVESYEFVVTDPWNRGEVVGGFGYIVREDPTENELVLVSRAYMDKIALEKPAQFWGNHKEKMMKKTIVNLTTSMIPLDPRKVNGASLAKVEDDENDDPKPERKQVTVIDAKGDDDLPTVGEHDDSPPKKEPEALPQGEPKKDTEAPY